MNKDRFFFFGFGQTARYLIRNLEKLKKKFTFSATNTKKQLLRLLVKKSFYPLSLKIIFMIKN